MHTRKTSVIVDDINDTGRTLCWIKDDWQCNEAWGNNVRTERQLIMQLVDLIHLTIRH